MKKSAASEINTAGFAQDYPLQRQRMLGYLIGKGVHKSDADDLVADAWTKGLDTFDSSKGLLPVQWVWWVLQHNILPLYFRQRNRHHNDLPADAADTESDSTISDLDDQIDLKELIGFLRKRLPPPFLPLFDTIIKVVVETNSMHIYREVGKRMNISVEECQNLLKRLRRQCKKLRTPWARYSGNKGDGRDR